MGEQIPGVPKTDSGSIVLIGGAITLVAVLAGWWGWTDAGPKKTAPDATAFAPAPAPPVLPPPPDPLIPDALTAIAKHRAKPKLMGDPECEPDGWCETQLQLRDDPVWLVARYRKSKQAVSRFTFHVRGRLTCGDLGGRTAFSWPENSFAAGGALCKFDDGALAGQNALIELNHYNDGSYGPGIHVFSGEYEDADRGFHLALVDDLARAARVAR
jgi:hypothetical protein